ncbi:MAG: chorismate synthase [Elusimicrobiota bacterium]
MIRYTTAGESHGKCVIAVIEGIPAGLSIDSEYINVHLSRRQVGYGRGKRMDIEKDKVIIKSGIRWGETMGSPICLEIENKDWKNNIDIMAIEENKRDDSLYLTRPRPGHADLAGAVKYNRRDIRDILERASARETAARVAAGAVARRLLEEFDIEIASFTRQIGKVKIDKIIFEPKKIMELTEMSDIRCIERNIEREMKQEIDKAKQEKDTLGGAFTVAVEGVPPGLGSHTQWDLKLDGRIAQALMSVQAIKGVEVGGGFDMCKKRGSRVHDEIHYDKKEKRFTRSSNNAGGIEGGMTNGEILVFTAAMKPISSLGKPLKSVDLLSKESVRSEAVRSDVCAVPAAGIIGEAVVCIEIAKALVEKIGGDSLGEMKRSYLNYLDQIKNY